MISASGYNDVVRIYAAAQADGVDYNLAFIGSDFTREYAKPFEQAYMRALFDYGYQRALSGDLGAPAAGRPGPAHGPTAGAGGRQGDAVLTARAGRDRQVWRGKAFPPQPHLCFR